MKNIHFFLTFFLISSLYSMNDEVEVTLANNQKITLTKIDWEKLNKCSETLKNAAQDFNEEQLPPYLPYIEDPKALTHISNLLNDEGTPNIKKCSFQTVSSWYTIAPVLEYLQIECFNPYITDILEEAHCSPTLCNEILRQNILPYETLPLTFKNELAGHINKKNVGALTKYYISKTISPHDKLTITTLGITPDGKTIVSGSNDKTVKLWDLNAGSLLKTLQGHKDCIKALAISPNGQTLISGSNDKTLKLWDLNTGSLQKTLQGHKDCIKALAISPNGQTIISGDDNTIKVWDLNTGSLLRISEELQKKGRNRGVNTLVISSDGKTLVSGSREGTLKLWDLTTANLLQTLRAHNGWVNAIAISPDNHTLVSGSDDKTIKVWDLHIGVLYQTLHGHKEGIRALAITPNGQTIVSGSYDKTLKLWDLNTGSLLQTLEGHEDWVTAIAISPDGQTIVSGSLNKNIIKLWKSNLLPELKNDLLQRPLEQALLIQALRTRPNLQEPFELSGVAREHFKRLPEDAQDFLCKELNIK